MNPVDLNNSGYAFAPFDGIGVMDAERSLGDSIFASINDAILVIDSEAVIERVNRAASEMTGYSEEELIGSHVEMLTRNRSFFERMFAKSLHKSIQGNRFEMKCRKKDGSLIPLSISTSSIFDTETSSQKLICVARDITKRKRLEAEAERCRAKLQGKQARMSAADALFSIKGA